MAHIICMTTGLTGILYASFEMVRRLETAGHRVTYACPQEVASKVQAQQITYFQLPAVNFEPAPPLPDKIAKQHSLQRILYKLRHRAHRQQLAIKALNMEPFITFLQEQSPDLILIDVELHDHIITAVAKKWPVVLISQWFTAWQRPGLPPISSTVIPGHSWRGHPLAIRLAWLRQNFRQQLSNQKGKWLSGCTDRRTILKKWAKDMGFPMAKLQGLYWPPPLTYSGLPIWHMTPESLEFPFPHSPEQAYLGPMVLENRLASQSDTALHDQLQAIFERKNKEGKLLIYCSVSSMDEGDLHFLRKIVAAVEKQDRYLLVIGLGGKIQPSQLGELPSVVFPFSWVPQLKVLAQADASINHGGIHTINECIHFAVPMLIYSGKRYDQNGCAARVQYHQAGIVGDKDLDDSHTILQKLNQLLDNPMYRQKVQALQKDYMGNKGRLEQRVHAYLSITATNRQASISTSL